MRMPTITKAERLSTVKITIEPRHLKAARALDMDVTTRTCVFGQALIEKFGDAFQECTSRDIICSKAIYRPLSKDQRALSRLVWSFDICNFDECLVLLPLTIRLKRVL